MNIGPRRNRVGARSRSSGVLLADCLVDVIACLVVVILARLVACRVACPLACPLHSPKLFASRPHHGQSSEEACPPRPQRRSI